MLTHNSVNVCVDLGENTIPEIVLQLNVIFENNNNVNTGFPWIDGVLRDMHDDYGAMEEYLIEELIEQLRDHDACAMLIAHLDAGCHYSEFDPYGMDDPIFDFEEYAYQLADDMLSGSGSSEWLLRYFDHEAFQRDLEFDYREIEVTSPFFKSCYVWFRN